MGIRDYNLVENKIEQQNPTPPPPQIKDEATQKSKRAIFPSGGGGGGGGGSKFSIYFVQDCSLLGRRSDSGERCEVKRTATG